jgi:thiol-disulfide isomerase/thioredoxin
MLERLLILLLAAALGVLAVLATRAWARRRTERLSLLPGGALLDALGAVSDGRPMVVTFSTPSCAACHTAQAPAARDVEQQLGADHVRVVTVDAASQHEIARAFGVLTVPSSVVLDASGRITAVNHGFAPSQKLIRQLQTA